MRHPTVWLPRNGLCRLGMVLALLVGASGPAQAGAGAPTARSTNQPAAPWHGVRLQAQSKPFIRFSVVNLDGQRVLHIEAEASDGNLVQAFRCPERLVCRDSHQPLKIRTRLGR